MTLEHSILHEILKKLPELKDQIEACHVVKKEYTGAGFYFELDVDKKIPAVDAKIKAINGPEIKSPQLESGAGSILFLEDGYLKTLEIFAYDNSFPEALKAFELKESHLTPSTHDKT